MQNRIINEAIININRYNKPYRAGCVLPKLLINRYVVTEMS